MTDVLIDSAAPVFEVDGAVDGTLARDLRYLEVSECHDGLRTLRMHLAAFGQAEGATAEDILYLDGDVVDFGAELTVSIGGATEDAPIFSGRISAIEGDFGEGRQPQVVIYAEDALMDLRMTRRFRTYEEVTDAEIAKQIADEHGLSVEADLDGPTHAVVQQWNMSDLAFLRERARLVQAEITVLDGTLHFKSRGRMAGEEITLVKGGSLIGAKFRADLAHQRTAVRVSGFDASRRELIEEEATVDAIRAEATGGRTGPEVLEDAFGARVSHRVREVPLDATRATAYAEAEMLRRGRGFVRVRGTTDGTPSMIVGSRLRFERVGDPFNGGGYVVTGVTHTYDVSPPRGYRTHFDAERPTVGGPA